MPQLPEQSLKFRKGANLQNTKKEQEYRKFHIKSLEKFSKGQEWKNQQKESETELEFQEPQPKMNKLLV